MHVVVAGGGTAGHIEPALAVADALRRRDPGITVTALGTARGLETTLVPARGYELALIPPVPIPRRLTGQLLAVPARVWASVRATEKVLRQLDADVVVGFGGYVAAPAYLAAAKAKIPIVVHEANPRPGWANRLGARLSKHVGTSTPQTQLPHGHYVGVPLRRSIAELDRDQVREQARAHFGLDPAGGPVLLVSGGSQGARSINQAVFAAAKDLVQAGVQVLHVTGPSHIQDAPAIAAQGQGRYVCIPFVERMDWAYAAADLMLCRSGAMTCAELAAVGLPAVFVPLPHGNGEQALNAGPLVDAGAAIVIADADLSPERVRTVVLELVKDPARLQAMSQAASALGRRDADERIADMVLDAVGTTAKTAKPADAQPSSRTEPQSSTAPSPTAQGPTAAEGAGHDEPRG